MCYKGTRILSVRMELGYIVCLFIYLCIYLFSCALNYEVTLWSYLSSSWYRIWSYQLNSESRFKKEVIFGIHNPIHRSMYIFLTFKSNQGISYPREISSRIMIGKTFQARSKAVILRIRQSGTTYFKKSLSIAHRSFPNGSLA